MEGYRSLAHLGLFVLTSFYYPVPYNSQQDSCPVDQELSLGAVVYLAMREVISCVLFSLVLFTELCSALSQIEEQTSMAHPWLGAT